MAFFKHCKNEVATRSNRADQRKGAWMGTAVFAATLAQGVVFAHASDIADFGKEIEQIIVDVYNASWGVMTVLAALLLVIALIVRMAAGQQRAQQATQWIGRILICYIAINCIGLIFNVINGTTSQHRFDHAGIETTDPADPDDSEPQIAPDTDGEGET